MLKHIGEALAVVAISVLVMLSGVGGAEAATPINSCGTLSVADTYRLTANLSISSGDCLIVAANSVTIDLNGFEISGNGTSDNGVTDGGSARKDIVVRDGTIRGFPVAGIALGLSTASLVDGLVLFDNGRAVTVGAGGTVKNSTMHDNTSANAATITVNGAGTVTDNVLVNNVASNANGHSILAGPHALVSGNTLIYNNSFFGIAAAHNSTVKNNVVSHNTNGSGAIVVNGHTVIVQNTVLNNTGFGFLIVCPSTVKFNTALNNGSTNLFEGGTGNCTNVGNNAP